jgi:phosphatidylinositol alpha-1,6-mannosyltransferase
MTTSPLSTTDNIRILFLATDAHGGFGGISQYNRDVLRAFSDIDVIERVVVVPRLMPEDRGEIPARVEYETRGLRSRWHFAWTSISCALHGKYDIIYCAHINLLPVARICQQLTSAPIVLAIYGIDVWSPKPDRIRKIIQSNVNLIVSISETTADRFLRWCDVPREKVVIVPNAIDLDIYRKGGLGQLPQVLKNARAGRVIMTMGRLVGQDRAKGFDEIISIMPRLLERYEDLNYVIVGDGPDRDRLEAKARETGVAHRVIFAGRIPEDCKIDVLSSADVFAMPSRGEGFGFVILEALACGVPVVASTCDGTREAIRDGSLGWLADPDDENSIIDAIEGALQSNDGIPEGLTYFDFPHFTQRIFNIIRSVPSHAQ